MTRHHRFSAAAAALLAVGVGCGVGCGYPSFDFSGSGGSGGASSATSTTSTTSMGGGPTTSTTSSTATSSTTTTTSTTTSTGSGPPPPCPDYLVISELRTRGPGGGDDDYVELYNPTSKNVVLGTDWTLQYQGPSDSPITFNQRWAGQSQIIRAHGYYLIAGSTYASSGETPSRDGSLSSGLPDEGAVFLVQGLNIIDTVCYFHDLTSQFFLEGHGVCEGTPAANPHDDTTNSNSPASIARAPLDCTDTDHNDADFQPLTTGTPQNSQSPTVVY